MRLAIITEDGEVPIASDDLADEISKALWPLTRVAFRGVIRRTIERVAKETKERTVYLGPQHR